MNDGMNEFSHVTQRMYDFYTVHFTLATSGAKLFSDFAFDCTSKTWIWFHMPIK